MTDTPLHAPWTLHFDRDGTEDLGTIRDAHGHGIVTSRPFWLPEGGDSVPVTLAALWAMTAAPELLAVLREGLDTLLDVQRFSPVHDDPGVAAALSAHIARVRAVLVEAAHGPGS